MFFIFFNCITMFAHCSEVIAFDAKIKITLLRLWIVSDLSSKFDFHIVIQYFLDIDSIFQLFIKSRKNLKISDVHFSISSNKIIWFLDSNNVSKNGILSCAHTYHVVVHNNAVIVSFVLYFDINSSWATNLFLSFQSLKNNSFKTLTITDDKYDFQDQLGHTKNNDNGAVLFFFNTRYE